MGRANDGEFPMAYTKSPKKNGTIEIRLSDEAKSAFMERCRRDERTASEAIRMFIDEQVVARSPTGRWRMHYWRIAAAGIVGIVLGVGVAGPSFARSGQDTRAEFDRLDRNHDGVVTYKEFRSR
jgi:hypothetical protein